MKESTEKSPNPMETFNGFSHVPSTPVFWKSRKRSVSGKKLDLDSATDEKTPEKQEELSADEKKEEMDVDALSVLSERRKALFEPLEPITNASGKRPSAESLLPPPDFDSSSYPKGWLIGKKRKLVNVDVVESMRRIAVQEMNRKDREIDGLNEQLEADARCLEHLQLQLLDERSKRADVERQNNMLQNQINMLMDMLQENDAVEGEDSSPFLVFNSSSGRIEAFGSSFRGTRNRSPTGTTLKKLLTTIATQRFPNCVRVTCKTCRQRPPAQAAVSDPM